MDAPNIDTPCTIDVDTSTTESVNKSDVVTINGADNAVNPSPGTKLRVTKGAHEVKYLCKKYQ